jgi:hypothetical protein
MDNRKKYLDAAKKAVNWLEDSLQGTGMIVNMPFNISCYYVDILSTAHLGLAPLYCGDLIKAISSDDFLQKVILKQKERSAKFYLRFGTHGELINNYPSEMAIFEDDLIGIQNEEGSWLPSQELLMKCDQTIEIATWLTEIAHASYRATSKLLI